MPDHERFWRYYALKPMKLTTATESASPRSAELDPYDTEAIAEFLGDWVRQVPMRA